MQLTRAADYAVRMMIHLSSLPQGSRVKLSALARAADAPESFISKVMQRLVRARLILSNQGAQGGYEMAAPADQISLLNVVEAIEGPMRLNVCLMSAQSCDRQLWCAAHCVWAEAQAAMVEVLSNAPLARLARESAARKTALAQQLSGDAASNGQVPES